MFNPDKLTSRSGRVAENSKKIKKWDYYQNTTK
jgi:hypothetical protein